MRFDDVASNICLAIGNGEDDVALSWDGEHSLHVVVSSERSDLGRAGRYCLPHHKPSIIELHGTL